MNPALNSNAWPTASASEGARRSVWPNILLMRTSRTSSSPQTSESRWLSGQVRRRAVVHEASPVDAALFAKLHPETVLAAREAELPEQVVYLAPRRAGNGDLHGRPCARA